MNKNRIRKYLGEIIIISVTFLFTFTKFTPEYGIGLDKSYMWALNWLFVNDYNTLINLIYPLGPLGFVLFPTTEGNNLLISIIFYVFVKIVFIILLFRLQNVIHGNSTLLSLGLIFIISYFAYIDFSVIASCLILNFLALQRKSLLHFAAGFTIGLIGLFIKSSIGIASASIVFMSLIINYYLYKDKMHLLKQFSIGLTLTLVFGLFIYKGNLDLLLNYFFGITKLTAVYSDRLSLHPDNNWIVLSLFFLTIFSIPVIFKDKNVHILSLLLLFPFFASWKHSMIREDTIHYTTLIYFVIVFGIILSLASQVKTIYVIFLIAVMLLYFNMKNIPMYDGIKRELSGINNFMEILDYQNFKSKFRQISENNISRNRLPNDTRSLIGEGSIDIYPWEFSFVAANDLNWKPRRNLSMDFDYNYGDKKSPEFILFHLNKSQYEGGFGSIDQRYILNDEPKVMHSILNNYSVVGKGDNYLLFRKSKDDNFSDIILGEVKNSKFNEWIKIPYFSNEITRLKIKSQSTFIGWIKKFLYKEEMYFVDYLFEDGKIFSYRYIPSTAADGLWCNPFISYPEFDSSERKVNKIRVRAVNSQFVNESIKIQTERIKIKTLINNNAMSDAGTILFKLNLSTHSVIFNSNITFENPNELQNQSVLITEDYSFEGAHSNQLDAGMFSFGYSILLDTLWSNLDSTINELFIETDVYLKAKSGTVYVVSVEASAGDSWQGKSQGDVTINDWQYLYTNKMLSRNSHSRGILKVYVWNTGQERAFIDNFRLIIKAMKRGQSQ